MKQSTLVALAVFVFLAVGAVTLVFMGTSPAAPESDVDPPWTDGSDSDTEPEVNEAISRVRSLEARIVNAAVETVHDEFNASTSGEPDDDWLAYPRTDWVPHKRFARLIEDVEAREWYRHVSANPRDVVIPLDDRAAIASLITRQGKALKEMRAAAAELREIEFGTLIASEQLQPLEYTTDTGQLAKMNQVRALCESRGHDPDQVLFTSAIHYNNADGLRWFRRVGEDVFGVGDDHLPGYAQAHTVVREAGLRYVASVTSCFLAAGCLTATEADQFIKSF